MKRAVVDHDANNRGRWLARCHNRYHGELGIHHDRAR